jgi:hypothetical protein
MTSLQVQAQSGGWGAKQARLQQGGRQQAAAITSAPRWDASGRLCSPGAARSCRAGIHDTPADWRAPACAAAALRHPSSPGTKRGVVFSGIVYAAAKDGEIAAQVHWFCAEEGAGCALPERRLASPALRQIMPQAAGGLGQTRRRAAAARSPGGTPPPPEARRRPRPARALARASLRPPALPTVAISTWLSPICSLTAGAYTEKEYDSPAHAWGEAGGGGRSRSYRAPRGNEGRRRAALRADFWRGAPHVAAILVHGAVMPRGAHLDQAAGGERDEFAPGCGGPRAAHLGAAAALDLQRRARRQLDGSGARPGLAPAIQTSYGKATPVGAADPVPLFLKLLGASSSNDDRRKQRNKHLLHASRAQSAANTPPGRPPAGTPTACTHHPRQHRSRSPALACAGHLAAAPSVPPHPSSCTSPYNHHEGLITGPAA